jgi:hypothetical protein
MAAAVEFRRAGARVARNRRLEWAGSTGLACRVAVYWHVSLVVNTFRPQRTRT